MNRRMTLLAGVWVLWKHTVALVPVVAPGTPPLERVIVTWQRQDAYETREACEGAVKAASGWKLICLPETGTPGAGESTDVQRQRGAAGP